MRFDINLATNPHQDARAFYLRAGSALGCVLLLTLFLLVVTVQQWRSTSDLNAKLDQVNRQIADLEKQKQESEAILNRPENRGTRDHSRFVNSLIAQKAFSWTQVFADLEKLMPTQVHLVSINPELNKQNQIAMHMIVAGNSRDKALELAHNLENSQHFREARVLAEDSQTRTQNSLDTIRFELSAFYVPEGNLPAQEKPRGGHRSVQ